MVSLNQYCIRNSGCIRADIGERLRYRREETPQSDLTQLSSSFLSLAPHGFYCSICLFMPALNTLFAQLFHIQVKIKGMGYYYLVVRL